jgi:hypothetical protein
MFFHSSLFYFETLHHHFSMLRILLCNFYFFSHTSAHNINFVFFLLNLALSSLIHFDSFVLYVCKCFRWFVHFFNFLVLMIIICCYNSCLSLAFIVQIKKKKTFVHFSFHCQEVEFIFCACSWVSTFCFTNHYHCFWTFLRFNSRDSIKS